MQVEKRGVFIKRKNAQVKVSSQVYAEFVLSRIPPEIRASLTPEQLDAFRNALIAQNDNQKHSLDIRVRLPFYFAAYYFVLFGGRDRRRSVRQLELTRVHQFPLWLRMTIYSVTVSIIVFTLFSVIFTGLYLAKSYAGIDLTPWHLYEIIPLETFNFGNNNA